MTHRDPTSPAPVPPAAPAAHPAGAPAALVELLYQLADDELALGHRDSEWIGVGPHLELDIAFASIAQDEVGHAAHFYRLLAALGEGGGSADAVAYDRPAQERRNAVLLERKNGQGHYIEYPEYDWAYTVARHYLYDVFEDVRLEALLGSSHAPLAQAAAKIRREERYHLLHHGAWLQRLATHSAETRARLQAALDQVWPDLGDLFSLGPLEEEMVAAGLIACGSAGLMARWQDRVQAALAQAGLAWPGPVPAPRLDGRRGQHTPDLDELLDNLTAVRRLDPAARW